MTALFGERSCSDSLIMDVIKCIIVVIGLMVIISLAIIGHRNINESQEKALHIVFKYMFYSCSAFAVMILFAFGFNVTICNINQLPHKLSSTSLITSFTIYGLILSHLFLCWLFRLYLTFHQSMYAKSITFYIIMVILFIIIALFAISGLILYVLSIQIVGFILVIMSAFGYLFVSIGLLHVFLRQLLELVTCRVVTVRFKTEATLKERTSTIDLSFKDQPMIHIMAKYFVLGTATSITTVLVLMAMIVYIMLLKLSGDNYINTIFHVLQILIMIDVITNMSCIYLQFYFAVLPYHKICSWCDNKVHLKMEHKALHKIRTDTFSFYAKKFADSLHASQHGVKTMTDSLGKIEEVPVTELQSSVATTSISQPQLQIDVDKLIDFKKASSITIEHVVSDTDNTPNSPNSPMS